MFVKKTSEGIRRPILITILNNHFGLAKVSKKYELLGTGEIEQGYLGTCFGGTSSTLIPGITLVPCAAEISLNTASGSSSPSPNPIKKKSEFSDFWSFFVFAAFQLLFGGREEGISGAVLSNDPWQFFGSICSARDSHSQEVRIWDMRLDH